MLLQDKVALITGGGTGIGRAAALTFAREGAQVMIAGRNAARLAETEALVRAGGGTIASVSGDVSQPADVARMVEAAVSRFGRLDVAFNNAAIGVREVNAIGQKLADYTMDQWNRLIAVNLTGAWLCMQAEIRAFGAKGGVILNTASFAGLIGSRGSAPYVATKHGVIGLTKSAALEYGGSGIRVNVICPGYVETPLIDHSLKSRGAELAARNPMNRVGQPGEIAALAAWLCSDQASFCNGAVYQADGGMLAG